MKIKIVYFIFLPAFVMTAVHCIPEYLVDENLIGNQSRIFQNLMGRYQGRLMGILPITFEIKNDNRPVLISDINGIIEYSDIYKYDSNFFYVKHKEMNDTYLLEKDYKNSRIYLIPPLSFSEDGSPDHSGYDGSNFTPEEESRLRSDLIGKVYTSSSHNIEAYLGIKDDSTIIMNINGIESTYTYTVDFSDENIFLILEKNGMKYKNRIRYKVKNCEKEPHKFIYDCISMIIYSDFYLEKMCNGCSLF